MTFVGFRGAAPGDDIAGADTGARNKARARQPRATRSLSRPLETSSVWPRGPKLFSCSQKHRVGTYSRVQSAPLRSPGVAGMRSFLRAVARDVKSGLAALHPGSRAGYASERQVVARERTAVTAKLWEDRLAQARASGGVLEAATQSQETLVAKPPTRSSIRYGFVGDAGLLEAYRNPWNAVRVGRVMEDLDSLAGTCFPISTFSLESSSLETR